MKCQIPICSHLGLLLVILTISAFSPQDGRTTEPPRGNESRSRPGMRFRPFFLPRERIHELLGGIGQYVPIQREEFHQLVKSINQNNQGTSKLRSRIERAEYHARLTNRHFLSGTAQFDVTCAVKRKTLLELEGLDLALTNPRWSKGQNPQLPLYVGLTGEDQSAAMIDHDGSISLDWTLRGEQDAYNVLTFQLALAPCLSNHITLDLPATFIPIPDQGVVFGPQVLAPTESDPEGDAKPHFTHRWKIEFGAQTKSTLRIVPRHLADVSHRLVSLRQSSNYTISQQGLDLSAELNCHVYHEPIREIVVDLDPGLHLTAAQLGNDEIEWSVHSMEGQTIQHAILKFTEPVSGKGRTIRLAAVAPLDGQSPYQLPSIRIQNVFWQEGRVTVNVVAPLHLSGIDTSGCHAMSRSAVTSDNLIASAEFSLSRQDATVTVELTKQLPTVDADGATTIRWGKTHLAGRFIGDFRCSEGELFDLFAVVPNHWIIDTVESLSSDPITDWKVEYLPVRGIHQLKIRLNQSLNPNRELRISISGRRRRTAISESLGVADFLFVDFEDVSMAEHWIALQAEAPQILQSSGDKNLRRGTIDTFSKTWKERIDVETTDLLFQADDSANPLQVWLSAQPTKFSVDITVEAETSTKLLSETHTFRVKPASNYVDSLIVRFSASRDVEPIWMIVDEPEGGLSPTRLPNQSPSTGRDANREMDRGETWELRLNRPRRTPFEIRAVRANPFDSATTVALASITNATEQSGLLTIKSNSSRLPTIVNHRLHPVPVASLPTSRYSTFQAAYRFEPERDADAAASIALVVSPKNDSVGNPHSWVWSCTIRSNFSSNGISSHVIRYDIENTVPTDIRLVPHINGHIRRVFLGPHSIPLPQLIGEEGVSFPLPEGDRYPVVTVEIESVQQPLRTWEKLSAPLPNIYMPILFSQWNVTIPHDYAIVNTQRLAEKPSRPSSWRRRLFGTLARADSTLKGHSDKTLFVSGTAFCLPPNPTDSEVTSLYPVKVETELSVYNSTKYDAYAWVTLMITAAVVWWQSRRVRVRWFLLTGTIATIALIVPEFFVPFTSCMMLGTFLGGMLAFCPTIPKRREKSRKQRESRTLTGHIAGGLLIVMSLTTSSVSNAQQPEKTVEIHPDTSDSLVERIYIPIEADNRPSDDLYYITKSAYSSLQERNKIIDPQPPDWLIQHARYDIALDWEVPETRLGIVSCLATFAFEAFRGNTVLRLRLRGDEVQIDQDVVQLDGRTVDVQWSESTNALEIPIDEPGTYQLAIRLQPRTRESESLNGWDLTIPAIADSKLTIRVPADAPSIEIPSRLGARAVDLEKQTITADLGPTNRLSVRWTGGTGMAGTAPRVDVEELFWLQIRPGSVVLDCRVSLNVSDGRLGSLSMRVDPRLRLLPQEQPSPIHKVHVPHDKPHTLVFELDDPTSDQMTLEARFLVTDTSGIGRIRYPTLKTNGAVVKRWLAVSTTPDLEFFGMDTHNRPKIPVTEFTRTWGGDIASPEHVLDDIAGNKDSWTVFTRPLNPRTDADQQLAIVFGQNNADVNLQLDLVTTDGLAFHQIITGPSNFEFTEILFADESGERQARWSGRNDGSVYVFLDPALTDRVRMTVRGRIPLTPGNEIPLPLFGISNVEVRSNIFSIYRRPGISLEIDEISGMNVVGMTNAEGNHPADTRLVNVWEIVDEKPHARLSVNSLATHVQAVQVTSLVRRESGWYIEIEYDGEVLQGAIDVLRFELPPICGLEIEVQPDIQKKIDHLPGTPERRLHLHLPDSENNRCQVHITIPITFPPGEQIHVPDIQPMDHPALSHYVIVPGKIESQPVEWDTLLRKTQLPDRFRSGLQLDPTDLVFRTDFDEFRVELQTGQSGFDLPLVRLVDIFLRWQSEDEIHGVVTFDLEPNGLEWCPVQLPKKTHIIHARVDGLPARIESDDEGAWHIALGSSVLPQRIEIIYGQQLDSVDVSHQSLKVHVPQLGKITVLHTLFTIVSPALVGHCTTDDDADAIGVVRQHLFRLKTLNKLMELPTHLLTEETPVDIAGWYQPWAQRYWHTHCDLKRSISKDPETTTSPSTEIDALDKQQTYIASHLGTSEILQQVRNDSDTTTLSNRRFLSSSERDVSIGRFMFTGPKSSIVLTYPKQQSTKGIQRLLMAFLLAGATWWTARREPRWINQCTGWIFRWPAFVGVVLGACWLLWFRPPWIGWVLIIVSIAGAISLPRAIFVWAIPSRRLILLRGRDSHR